MIRIQQCLRGYLVSNISKENKDIPEGDEYTRVCYEEGIEILVRIAPPPRDIVNICFIFTFIFSNASRCKTILLSCIRQLTCIYTKRKYDNNIDGRD